MGVIVFTHTIGSNLLHGMTSVVFGIGNGGQEAHHNQRGGACGGNVFHGWYRKLVRKAKRGFLVDPVVGGILSVLVVAESLRFGALGSCVEEEEEGGWLCLLIL